MDKNKLLRSVGLSMLAMTIALLMACGQKGPLTLPQPSQTKAAASAASAPVKP